MAPVKPSHGGHDVYAAGNDYGESYGSGAHGFYFGYDQKGSYNAGDLINASYSIYSGQADKKISEADPNEMEVQNLLQNIMRSQTSNNVDYFAVGMRPCLTQFPPWLNKLVCDGSGRVKLYLPELQGQGEEVRDNSEDNSLHTQSGPFPRGKPWKNLHEAFDAKTQVQALDPTRFELQRVLQAAQRNQGEVRLMWDNVEQRMVASKMMPNQWVRNSHSDFLLAHPVENEWPWQDIGCSSFLNAVGFPYSNTLYGVHRGLMEMGVMTSFCNEGDLFTWCSKATVPQGPAREELIRPIAVQLLEGLKQLHELSIMHLDISMENCLVNRDDSQQDAPLGLRIIDFGMAQTVRYFSKQLRGKRSYQAPEQHHPAECDALLSDVFAAGVCLYCILVMDYPWQATFDGGCKCFDFACKYGFRMYCAKRKVRNSSTTVEQALSENALKLLEGMLSFDPRERLTLGESSWSTEPRRSVWDEEWLQQGYKVEL